MFRSCRFPEMKFRTVIPEMKWRPVGRRRPTDNMSVLTRMLAAIAFSLALLYVAANVETSVPQHRSEVLARGHLRGLTVEPLQLSLRRLSSPEETYHKNLFPLTWRDTLGFAGATIGLVLAAGGGIGGGGILVPIFILVMGFEPKHAIPLANVSVFGGAIANTLLNVRKRHPQADRPLINFELILVMEPLTMAGALIGALAAKVCDVALELFYFISPLATYQLLTLSFILLNLHIFN